MPTRPSHGERRRAEILAAAADLSTTEGLDGLSFARLADEVGLTKAGVAAHFDSKSHLQLEVVEFASRAYGQILLEATRDALPGLQRLRAIALAWFEHLETIDYRGGCFFAAAGQAFGGRPGPVRDAIAESTRALMRELDEQAALASRLGEIDRRVDPAILAFQIHAIAQEANLRRELLDEVSPFDRARSALDFLLQHAASEPAESTR